MSLSLFLSTVVGSSTQPEMVTMVTRSFLQSLICFLAALVDVIFTLFTSSDLVNACGGRDDGDNIDGDGSVASCSYDVLRDSGGGGGGGATGGGGGGGGDDNDDDNIPSV